jgi:aromatic-L-amino-acid decarboxylase
VSVAAASDRPSDKGAGHPEPELIHYRDPARSRRLLRDLGDDTWRLALDWLYGEGMRRAVGPETYPELRRRFFGPASRPAPAPAEPTCSADLLDEVRDRLSPYQFSTQHPRTFSYFTPPPLPIAIAGETLALWWQQSVDVWHVGPSAALVEEEVIAWLRTLVGFGDGAWGVLTSGGAMANLMALAVARDVLAASPRGEGLEGRGVYVSDQAHFSVARALDVLGFPRGTLRVVPSDAAFRLRADAVAAAIVADRRAGRRPLAIVAGAGTTNTGSVDELDGLARLAADEGVWLHVDAAYGAAALFTAEGRRLLLGIERADSVTVDPHKWFFQPHDVGGLLIRRREDLVATFRRAPEYLRSSRPEDEPLDWFHYSVEGTRRFRALKLWLSWKHLGTRGFADLVEANLRLARYLAERCAAARDLEPAPPDGPALSVVCFRHVPRGLDDPDAVDRHQTAVQRALELSGEGWVSTTRLRGRVYLRAGVVNYLATEADVDRLLDAICSVGTSD